MKIPEDLLINRAIAAHLDLVETKEITKNLGPAVFGPVTDISFPDFIHDPKYRDMLHTRFLNAGWKADVTAYAGGGAELYLTHPEFGPTLIVGPLTHIWALAVMKVDGLEPVE